MFVVPYALRRTHPTRPAWAGVFDDASLDQFFARPTSTRTTPWDVAESGTTYTLTMDLPGFDKADVKVAIDAKRVSIEAKTPSAPAGSDAKAAQAQRERSFSQAFTLPVEIDAAASTAKLERGVLTLLLQKKPPPEAAVLTIN